MKKNGKKLLGHLLAVLVGVALGLLIGVTLGLLMPDGVGDTGWPVWADIAAMMLAALIAFLLQTVVHEGGHLVCGLLSGYEFLSFRVGSVMLVKQGDKLVWRRFSLPGTAGQCLMMPKSEDAPQLLYNLGGGLANLALSGLALLLIPLSSHFVVGAFACFLFLWGVVMAATNLIPLRMGGVANDGFNARALKNNEQARRAFLNQLRINGQLAQGVSLKDMPQAWFALPVEPDWDDPLVCSGAYLDIARRQDRGDDLAQIRSQTEELMGRKGLLGLHRNELTCDLVYCELLLDNRPEERERLYTPEIQKYVKATQTHMPHRHSLLYAWALLADGDAAKAEKHLAAFEKGAANYPYPVEMEKERRMMALAREKAKQ